MTIATTSGGEQPGSALERGGRGGGIPPTWWRLGPLGPLLPTD
ncbi:hypothetical protein [Micromonospora sp. NPDC050200]